MLFWCEVQFYLCSLLALFRSVTSGSAAPISTNLRRGPRRHFPIECYTASDSMAAPRMNLAPTHQRQARGWTGRKYRFSSLQYDPTGSDRTHPTRFGGACSSNCTA